MDTFLVSVASIVVGVVATFTASRYYYRRSTERALTPYIQFYTSVFRGVDAELRDNLKILYKDVAVTDLLEVQFLVANTGFRPIRGVIDPLKLQIPDKGEVLDAAVLHVHPEERRVGVAVVDGSVTFDFPLLNANEFFIAKLLLKGDVDPRDLSFRITAEDLPPVLKAELLAPDLVQSDQERQFEAGMLIAGLLVSLFGAAFASLIFEQSDVVSALWRDGITFAFRRNWFVLASVAVGSLPTLLLLVAGPMLMIGAFTDFSFPRRRRFSVPSDFRRSFYQHLGEIAFPREVARGGDSAAGPREVR